MACSILQWPISGSAQQIDRRPEGGLIRPIVYDFRNSVWHVAHEWMLKLLQHRIGDERVIRLIARMLKGGIPEDGLVQATEEGTPQGSILSPLLSNICLGLLLQFQDDGAVFVGLQAGRMLHQIGKFPLKSKLPLYRELGLATWYELCALQSQWVE